jgi:tetratricopeptide (TPR) repeat protein
LRSFRSFLLASLLCATGFAQTPSATLAETSGAKASFEQGMEAYRNGRYRAAIEHFQEADRLAPSPRLSFNVARAYEEMEDGPHALAAYRDYLRRLPSAENAAETSIRISELELDLQKTGVQQLSVIATPAGATVIIDDVSRGVSPWTGELSPGSHRLQLRLRGYSDFSQSFELPARHAIDLVPSLVPLASPPAPHVEPLPPAPLAVHDSPGPRWWTWTLFGGSAALLLGSGALELSRRSYEHSANNNRVQIPSSEAYDTMTSRMIAARVLLGAGVLMGAAGGVSLYFDLRGSRRSADTASTRWSLACGADECLALAGGTW